MKSTIRNKIKKTGVILILLLLLLQFIPKPVPNKTDLPTSKSIETIAAIPDTVHTLLKLACYDCHSNNTVYPWYSKIHPVAWYLDKHIVEGKHELNFDEFAGYSIKRQRNKLESLVEQVREGQMPLASYTFLHRGARLNKDQKELIIQWADELQGKIKQ